MVSATELQEVTRDTTVVTGLLHLDGALMHHFGALERKLNGTLAWSARVSMPSTASA